MDNTVLYSKKVNFDCSRALFSFPMVLTVDQFPSLKEDINHSDSDIF